MNNDIFEFLPIYYSINDKDFYTSIKDKKEFNEYKLEKEEDELVNKGDLYNYQKIISRFISSNTNYNRLLLFWEMGVGKTCSAIAVCEKIKNENTTINGAIVIAKSGSIIDNFINELVFKCTDGRYIPENYDTLKENVVKRKIRKMYSVWYQFETYNSKYKKWDKNTYEIIAKNLQRMSDENIINTYSNKIIIVDEIHNIKTQANKDTDIKLSIYNQFYRLFHLAKNTKILLLSGTPMTDSVNEIADVMNLLLPENIRLPNSTEFSKNFIDVPIDDIPKQNKLLKSYFKGYISYLSSSKSNVNVKFIGNIIDPIKYYKLDIMKMSDFQGKIYKETIEEINKGIYVNTEQASLLVYPNGKYGKDGFNSYFKKKTRKVGNKTLSSFIYRSDEAEESLRKAFTKQLQKHSIKYFNIINILKKTKKQGKNVFIYNRFVSGSGNIILSKILEMYGYEKATGRETTKGLRYFLVTNSTTYDEQIRRVINRFNKPDNINGEYIQVVIGSKKIAEGFSLFNIQKEIIVTPHWNYSEISQALARGIRSGSHKMLLEKNDIVDVEIHQFVATYKNSISIDLQKYKISEKKDIKIKKIERLMKESAIDCSLNYVRNRKFEDNSRDCEFMDCDYKCDDVDNFDINQDLSTYQLYYGQKDIDFLVKKIIDLFKDQFEYNLQTILGIFKDYTSFQVLTAINLIVKNNEIIKNRFNIDCYLREDNNIFYLYNKIDTKTDYLDSWYVKNLVSYRKTSIEDYVKNYYKDNEVNLIKKLFSYNNIYEFITFFKNLNIDVQEQIIKDSILAEAKKIEEKIIIRRKLLQYFKEYILTKDKKIFLFFKGIENTVVFQNLKWRKATPEELNFMKEYKEKLIFDIETNPYGYYGTYNYFSNKFCIKQYNLRDVEISTSLKLLEKMDFKIPTRTNRVKIKVQKYLNDNNITSPSEDLLNKLYYILGMTGRKSGLNCKSYKINEKEGSKNISLKQIVEDINKKRGIDKDDKEVENLNKKITEIEDNFTKILLGIDFTKKTYCAYLFDFFYKENLMIFDDSCGKN